MEISSNVSERLREKFQRFGRTIAFIGCIDTHDKLEMKLYERKLERLNEIRKELPALVRHIAA